MVKHNDKVLVAMSGGVDSAVAAALLRQQGYDVTGVFLCLGRTEDDQGPSGTCCSLADARDARSVARMLKIRFFTLPVWDDFEPIIEHFVAEYVRGRTPNPCIECNTKIKFGRLFGLADALGVKYVATGHYARIADLKGRPRVLRARDRNKDQSYALFGISRDRLDRILLPIGQLESKAHVRDIARGMGLSVSEKPDSQEVCFAPDGDYVSLLRSRAPESLRSGKIVNSAGHILGTHNGYARFTIGQRRGLGVAVGEPLYVTQIDPDTATVTVGTSQEIFSRRLTASMANWHTDVWASLEGVIQIRYNHRPAPGTVAITGADSFEVTFDEPVAAVTCGQGAVIYQSDHLVGGGWIDTRHD